MRMSSRARPEPKRFLRERNSLLFMQRRLAARTTVTAHAESYVLIGLLRLDGKTARFLNGRYVDRLEKRDVSDISYERPLSQADVERV